MVSINTISLSAGHRLVPGVSSGRVTLTAIVILGIALRWWSAAMHSDLWYDEVYSLTIARQPFGAMIHTLLAGAEANPPLYPIILHFWLKLGDSDTQVKLLSLILGAGSIPVMYALARRIGGKSIGRLSSILLATSQAAIDYSGQARCYSAFLLLSLLSTWSLISIICSAPPPDDERAVPRRLFAAYSISTALMIYTHWFGLLVVAIQATGLICYPYSRRIAWQYALSLSIVGLLSVPLVPFIWNQLALRQAAGGYLWPGRPGSGSVYNLASFLLGGHGLLAVAGSVFVFAGANRRGRLFENRNTRRHAIFFANYLVLPIILVYSISNLLSHYSFFVFRYFLPFVIGIQILMGLALSRIPRRAAVGFLAIFVIFPLIRYFRHRLDPGTPYSQIASALPDQLGGTVAVVHLSPMSYFPVLHYGKKSAPIQRVLSNKASVESRLRVIFGTGLMVPANTIDLASLSAYKAIWVIFDPIDQDVSVRVLSADFQNCAGFSLESEKQYSGVRLAHFVARPN